MPSPAVCPRLHQADSTLTASGILSDTRLSGYPDTPTVMETFGDEYNLVMKGWVAVAGPAGMEEDKVELLSNLMGAALQTDEYKEQIESLGMEYIVLYGDELRTFLDEQMGFYEEVCAGIEIE